MTKAHILGFPRIGRQREMKKAVEAYWAGKISQSELIEKGKDIRKTAWAIQNDAGLDFVTVGDFSWYDHVLKLACEFDVVPERYNHQPGKPVDLDTFFRIARGRAPTGQDVAAAEMTKWFDTNYHYIVPELKPNQEFSLVGNDFCSEVEEAKALGYTPKPVIVGPITFLWLSKMRTADADKLQHLDKLVVAYGQLLQKFAEQGVEWVQIDEPILCLNLPTEWRDAFESAYTRLNVKGVNLMLATYFGDIGDNTSLACHLPVAGLHIDLTRGQPQLTQVIDQLPNYKVLSLGIVDGRNIWRADLSKLLKTLESAKERLQERLWISSSCSLLHCPYDVEGETALDADIKSWLAFSVQKVSEIATLAKGVTQGVNSISAAIKESDAIVQSRGSSPKIHQDAVKKRTADVTDAMCTRNDFSVRVKKQRSHIKLPLFPTTTIGSFPQTQEIRGLRRQLKAKEITQEAYTKAIQEQIAQTVEFQENVGLDVLVHGEAERNDMVEYFGEHLEGFAFTGNGWVQSYGSRCVKPPIIYGDVSRPNAMTVDWTTYAQSLTKKPMKGMLTGPVTILFWSFVRDDQPRSQTAKQIALALRDEVVDLEKAGIQIIQIDEPAFREGLPLKQSDWSHYLTWAVKAFRLAVSGVKDTTQIHTHMCYSEFNDVIDSIAALDADVITIETSRSQMELLEAFESFRYPNEIGPGVYDIHSPRVPSADEMVTLLRKAMDVISFERLWVNPDCGLKTRAWPETQQALKNMVTAATTMRELAKAKQAEVAHQ